MHISKAIFDDEFEKLNKEASIALLEAKTKKEAGLIRDAIDKFLKAGLLDWKIARELRKKKVYELATEYYISAGSCFLQAKSPQMARSIFREGLTFQKTDSHFDKELKGLYETASSVLRDLGERQRKNDLTSFPWGMLCLLNLIAFIFQANFIIFYYKQVDLSQIFLLAILLLNLIGMFSLYKKQKYSGVFITSNMPVVTEEQLEKEILERLKD